MGCECNINNIYKIIIPIAILVIILIITLLLIYSPNNQSKKDILTAIAVNGDNQTLGATTIKFSQNKIVEGTAISHEPGSDTININETGIYLIAYQLYGTRQTIGTFNFNAGLLVNDTLVDDAVNDGPILRDNVVNRMTLTNTVILELNAGDTLKLVGISIEDITYEKARINIEKIG